MAESRTELIVEVLDQPWDWGRSEYIHSTQSDDCIVRVLSLLEAHTPIDDPAGLWLDLKKYADTASEMMRDLYPRFLHETAKSSGLLDITVLDEKASLYWFMPISEMSLLRNPLIDKIYALLVLKLALQDTAYTSLTFVFDDPLLEQPLRQIASQLGSLHVKNIKIKPGNTLPYYKKRWSLIRNWMICFVRDLATWFALRVFKIGSLSKDKTSTSNVIGLTIFPTLWAKDEFGRMQNRAFGDFPREQEKHGHVMRYLALPTMKLSNLFTSMKYWRTVADQNNISFVHSLVTIRQIFAIYFRQGWGPKISHWHKELQKKKCSMDDIDLTALYSRESLQEIWEPAIAQSLMLAWAGAAITSQADHVMYGVFAFEFQPIEKAFIVGIKSSNSKIPMVGLQTSLIGKTHLGYHFLSQQISNTNEIQPPYAPMPDYLATYGNIPYALLEKKLGTDRVMLSGPIRYPYLKVNSLDERTETEIDLKRRLNLNNETVLALLALPSLKEEALAILNWAIKISKDFPNLYLLVRFHYWVVLSEELIEISRQHSFDRYQVASGDLNELLLASRFMITGTSSVGVEAMVSGCMPISYKTTRRYDFGQVQNIAEGAFFYTNEQELREAMSLCISQGEAFAQRREKWPFVLQRICTPLDGKASVRFYEWMNTKGVFAIQNDVERTS